jgi:hypothetical protein
MTPPPSGGSGLMTNLAAKSKQKMQNAGMKIHGGADPSVRLLFWFSVLVHVIIVIFGWFPTTKLDTSTVYYGSIILFLILSLWAAIVFRGIGAFDNARHIFIFLLVSAAYVLVPFLLGMLGSIGQIVIVNDPTIGPFTISMLLVVFPIWPLLIGFMGGMPIASKWVNFWIVGLLVVFVLAIVLNYNVGSLMRITGSPGSVDIGGGFGYLVNQVSDIGTTLWNKVKGAPDLIKNRLNSSAIMGSINYYTGYVDDNENVPVGLYLRNIESDKESYEGSPAYIWGDIQGKSFTQEIIFEPYCFIDEKNVGLPEPRWISIFGSEQDRVYCKFDNLTKGSYSVKFGGKFTFDTWAYVEYTFVDMNVRRAMETEGKNINSELNIPLRPRSVYTAGPIMLGMAPPIDQPFGIDTQYNTRETPLGITIDNLWSEGKPERTRTFTILVPNDFELVKCDRGDPVKTTGTGYSNYTFNVGTMGDIRENFLTINCRLHINDPGALLGGAQKVQRTFVGMARYDYKIEKTGRIYVKE